MTSLLNHGHTAVAGRYFFRTVILSQGIVTVTAEYDSMVLAKSNSVR